MHFPKSLYRAATAVLRPGAGAGEPLAVLELQDPVLQPDPRWQSASAERSVPLAYDMTVPLARQLHVANLNLIGALGVLDPSAYNNRTGIYMLDPYVPGKIPVVFVHGLMSSPAAWTNAMNDLRGDPELRKRYQFWMFFYSTGNPLLASGARFRKALADLRVQLDPDHQDPAFDHMILIGHSMGGLMSRLAISESGQALWNTASKVPPDQVQLEPELKDLLMQALFFEPVPMVSRVVFISTPHRGSPLGDDLIGRLSSRLIRVPSSILEIRKTLAQLNGDTDVSQAFRGTRYATGVAQLGLGNPVLQAIDQLPLSDRVPYHSIVGYNGREPLPEGGDGVVPYTSAHIEGALSELIVSSDHSAQETEAGIREMRRILALHLGEYDLERKALAAGSRPAIRVTRPNGRTPVRYELAPPPASAAAERMARSGPPPEARAIR
jgi:pimeloyl-ACP methyl ester carboxylesterase